MDEVNKRRKHKITKSYNHPLCAEWSTTGGKAASNSIYPTFDTLKARLHHDGESLFVLFIQQLFSQHIQQFVQTHLWRIQHPLMHINMMHIHKSSTQGIEIGAIAELPKTYTAYNLNIVLCITFFTLFTPSHKLVVLVLFLFKYFFLLFHVRLPL